MEAFNDLRSGGWCASGRGGEGCTRMWGRWYGWFGGVGLRCCDSAVVVGLYGHQTPPELHFGNRGSCSL